MNNIKMKLKQLGAVILIVTTIATVLAGCAKKNPAGMIVNEKYDESAALLTVSGESAQPDNDWRVLFPELGLGFLVQEEWMDIIDNMTFVAIDQAYCISFLPPSVVPDFENMSDEEFETFDSEAIYQKQLPVIKILYTDAQLSQDDVQKENSGYQALEKLATLGKNTYYIAYSTSFPANEYPMLSSKDMNALKILTSSIDEFKKDMIIFPIQDAISDSIPSDAPQSLQAVDMGGNAVSSDIFAQYDLTAINIWATWCGSCVSELPELAKLYKGLPKNINFISICADGAEEKETANQMLLEAGCEFTTLAGDEAMRNGLLANIYSYPTTLFVDKNGTIVGELFIGAGSCEDFMREIEQRLTCLH